MRHDSSQAHRSSVVNGNVNVVVDVVGDGDVLYFQ